MTAHPLIHAELARQRQLDLRRSSASRQSAQLPRAASAELTLIVSDAVSGDQRAWEALVDRFTPKLRGVVRGYPLDPAEIDDVVQAAWALAFVNIDRLRDPAAMCGWLLVIARRQALRTLERRRLQVLVDKPLSPEESDHSAPVSALAEPEKRRAVQAAVERPPDHHRRLLRMLIRHWGTSYANISRQLDIPTQPA
jgi:RNA polymerase sigma factor (sigma-70 family)